MNDYRINKQRLQPLVAAKALRNLIKDPDQTDQVFIVIRAMSGDSLTRAYNRFRKIPMGQKILSEQRQILDVLQNREKLSSYPVESLGREYLAFVERGQITADGLVDASDVNEDLIEDNNLKLFAERLRDQHDLWHTLTQYGRDPFGEACLLAFTYAQTRNRGLGTIAFIGMLKLSKELGFGVVKAMWRGYRDGKRAAWLPVQDWEQLLMQPIDEVRQQMHIDEPDIYHEVLELHIAGL